MENQHQLVHLLYVPTIYCNLGCSYCYLGSETDAGTVGKDSEIALETLKYTVNKFQQSGITPFNISLHGGEVTTLPSETLSELFRFITDYYDNNHPFLERNGFRKRQPHIKTNLYNFDKHYKLFSEHEVSISASIDLPLSLHGRYRITKTGKSTLDKSLNNIRLLSKYPHRKKISAVLYQEHLDRVDDIIADIWYLHRDCNFDMNFFNFMFGFESSKNDEKFHTKQHLNTKAVDDIAQVEFYQRMKQEFLGTELSEGFQKHWFDEFTTSYCTNSFNCGEKFFLLQSDGSIYSCVRGQGSEPFYYGNAYENSIASIMERAKASIGSIHRTNGLHSDCRACEYLAICHTGCPFVKHQQQQSKSYTCALQKQIYRDYPNLYPATPVIERDNEVRSYIVDMHPHILENESKPTTKSEVILPNDLYEENNALTDIIQSDTVLQVLYGEGLVFLEINGDLIALESQILKQERQILFLNNKDKVNLLLDNRLFEIACNDPVRNSLHLQFLRDTPITYGDEKRTKQEHTVTHELFRNLLTPVDYHGREMLSTDIGPLLNLAGQYSKERILNNLFITTSYLRRYHYEKQKNNAFYHIQAINLPFHNIEYFWSIEC